jgi:hypothetical protein
LPDLDGPAPGGGTPAADTASLSMRADANGLVPAAFPLDSEGLDESLFAPLTLDGHVSPSATPRVAIIVDDGGNNRQIDDGFLALDPGLTLAILPFTPFDTYLATEGAARGFEIMLHMPMESSSSTVTHPGMILTTMKSEDIATYTESALDRIPGVEGINNHTGSKFTEFEDGMRLVMAVLHDRNLYFIDSRTSAQSVAPAVAREVGVPVAIRDVFLDNEADPDYIGRQFNELMAKAKERGFAIGICHFRPVTLQVMSDLLPKLESEGIDLVHASEFVQ